MSDTSMVAAPPDTGRTSDGAALRPYVPDLVVDWLSRHPERRQLSLDGTLLFADISGFTRLTERLARLGRVGAEEMSDALNATFGELLTVAAGDGADLLKWGGDAVLLLFRGGDHPARACRAAFRMRERLRTVGRLTTSAGGARLRMSQGIHSGRFHFFLVGDPVVHRELLVCGPEVSRVVAAESAANAGEIAVTAATGARLGAIGEAVLGLPVDGIGRLLRRCPDLPDLGLPDLAGSTLDVAGVLPQAIRAHLLQGAGEPEHRAIAVGFVAFSGIDALLTARGPEAAAEALDACVRNVASAVRDHGVTFFESDINRDGGKIMLTAGAPTSAGDDAERMLRAARLIVERAGELPVRVGVNVGAVFSGDFGPSFRRTYSVKGDAINLAARLVARATPGQVLATAAVPARSTARFDLTAVPPFTVKGKKRPVDAVLVGALAADSRHRAGSVGALVGRAPEAAVLATAVAGAVARRGGLVEIVGEAGLGKSRLLAEARAMARRMTVLSVVCDQYAAATPYHPVGRLLRDLLGIPTGAEVTDVAGRLEERVRVNAPTLVDWLPLLGAVLDVALPDTDATRSLGDEFRRRRLHEVVADFLHVALPTPTLLTIDDAQFLDGASADLLDHLTSRLAAEPWLVLLARREQPRGWAGPAMAATSLRIAPLSADESVALVQQTAGERPIPPQIAAALATRAGGNPLFLESLVLQAGTADAADRLPESVQELITAQVDRLSPADRTVLRYASVLGNRFEPRTLSAITDGRLTAVDAHSLERLADFVVPDDKETLRFRHGLMREVVYEGLPYRTRQRLHHRVAAALESGPTEPSPELLSLHYFEARSFDKAWHYSREAAVRAGRKYANQEAVQLLRRAVDAERQGPSGMVSPAELGAVLETLGDTWFTIGLTDEAADTYRRARRQLAADPVHVARVVAKEARIDQRLRRLPQSLRRVTRALRELEQVPGRWASSARSLLAMRYAISRFAQGRVPEALSWGQRAARDAEESVDKATLAQAYATLHGIYVAAGLESPIPYGELALQAYVELGDLPHQADCINNLAVSALDRNRWVEAADGFGRAADSYRRIGDTQGEGLAMYNRADVLLRQGRMEEAGALLDEALLIARSVSDDDLVVAVLREARRVRCSNGDVPGGVALIEEARQGIVAIDEPEELPATDLALAEASLIAGDPEGCLGLSAEPPSADDAVLPAWHRVRGYALLALGRSEAAEVELRAGVAAAEAQDNRYAGALNQLGLAVVLGDPGLADEARSVLEELGVARLPVEAPWLDVSVSAARP